MAYARPVVGPVSPCRKRPDRVDGRPPLLPVGRMRSDDTLAHSEAGGKSEGLTVMCTTCKLRRKADKTGGIW
jgi:hypothetical protein